MSTEEGSIPRTFAQLGRQQLEIYARELQQHIQEERRLLQEIENRNQQLEKRVGELTALNSLFQVHLGQHFSVVEAFQNFVEGLQQLAHEATDLASQAPSRPIPHP